MLTQIPDGEYDVDMSDLFTTQKDHVFGLRFGFKPDTIDESYASYIYTELDSNGVGNTGNGNDINDSNTVNHYLMTESKENAKAVTTNLNKLNQIFFEGKSQSVNVSSFSNVNATSTSEFLLSFDTVSNSFKMSEFDGFIKMNKSRDPESINHKILELNKTVSDDSEGFVDPNTLVDSLLKNLTASATPDPKVKQNPVPNKSYIQSISGISPVRKSSAFNTPSITPTATPITSPRTTSIPNSPSIHKSSVDTTTSSLSKTSVTMNNSINTPSTVISSSNNSRQTSPVKPNGGTGLKKNGKSSLLRKAERSLGIKSSSSSTSSSISKINKNKANSLKIDKQPINKVQDKLKSPLKVVNSMKKTKSDNIAFELNLVPPPSLPPNSAKGANPAPTSAKLNGQTGKGKGNGKVKDKGKDINTAVDGSGAKINRKNTKVETLKDENMDIDNIGEYDLLKELESEMDVMNVEDDCVMNIDSGKSLKKNANADQDKDKESIKVENNIPETQKTKAGNEIKNDKIKENGSGNSNNGGNDQGQDQIQDQDEEFEIDLSDWDDAEHEGQLISDIDNDTLTNGDFQLIIEDDPTKTKLENQTEMEKQREKERMEELEFDKKLKESMEQKQKDQASVSISKNTKSSKKTTAVEISNGKKSVAKRVAKKPTKAAKTRNGKEKDKQNDKHRDDDTTAAVEDESMDLDAELEKAMDDIYEEEMVSEEE